jgi:ATP-dependent DNA helicase PIF1
MAAMSTAAAAAHIKWPAGVQPSTGFSAVIEAARQPEANLFVTGRAGTGKSTLLRCLRANLPQKTAVLAPTGLAAVNVQGQTIHSFFGFPPQLITADIVKKCRRAGLFKHLETLIIDEISMVRADLMQGIDQALRMTRKQPAKPFGGVQVIAMGDLHQLAPVIRDRETQQFFHETFGGIYFFHAPVCQDQPFGLMELGHVYRQQDEVFIRTLNAFREGQPSRDDFDILNERVAPFRSIPGNADYTVLTTINNAADSMNRGFLNDLKGSVSCFNAIVTGKFDKSAYPTDENLELKEGSKVVMLRNDPDKRWVNGTLAHISKIRGQTVWVEIAGEEHELEPVTWENAGYEYDPDTDEMKQTVVGTFRQLPVRLAWALTIHKSQGMTLEKVYIDFGRGTFAHGQAYVALSRARSLAGLALARHVRQSDIIFDPQALGYRRLFDRAA